MMPTNRIALEPIHKKTVISVKKTINSAKNADSESESLLRIKIVLLEKDKYFRTLFFFLFFIHFHYFIIVIIL